MYNTCARVVCIPINAHMLLVYICFSHTSSALWPTPATSCVRFLRWQRTRHWGPTYSLCWEQSEKDTINPSVSFFGGPHHVATLLPLLVCRRRSQDAPAASELWAPRHPSGTGDRGPGEQLQRWLHHCGNGEVSSALPVMHLSPDHSNFWCVCTLLNMLMVLTCWWLKEQYQYYRHNLSHACWCLWPIRVSPHNTCTSFRSFCNALSWVSSLHIGMKFTCWEFSIETEKLAWVNKTRLVVKLPLCSTLHVLTFVLSNWSEYACKPFCAVN